MSEKAKKGNWIVIMKCIVIKELYVENCTEQEARNDPFGLASNENEVSLRDWEVKSIEPSE